MDDEHAALVDLWWADLTSADVALLDGLPERERERVGALERPADRGRRLVGAALLQHAVLATRGTHAPVDVDRTCRECGGQHGRPTVGGGPHVSVAHAGLLVVVATCSTAVPGVDVERWGRFCGAVPQTVAWVRHEAEVKAGVTAGGGTTCFVEPPLPGYSAALCVRTDGRVRVREHRVVLRPE